MPARTDRKSRMYSVLHVQPHSLAPLPYLGCDEVVQLLPDELHLLAVELAAAHGLVLLK